MNITNVLYGWKKDYDLGLREKPWHRWKVSLPHDDRFWVSGCIKMFPFKWMCYVWGTVKIRKRKWEILKV